MKRYKSLLIFVLIVSCLLQNQSPAQNLWEPMGVDGGRVSTILKVTDSVFLAGYIGGGLYRSIDGGINWYSVSNSIANLGVFVLKLSPSGDVFAGTLNSIYKSTDQGATWNKVNNSLPQNGYAEDITIDTSGNIYVASNYGGVYKSTDNGNSFAQTNNGLHSSKYISKVEYTSNNILIAADQYHGIYKSTDMGANWIQSNSGYDTTYYITRINSGASGDIFISTAGSGPLKSTDNGNSWVSIIGDLSLNYSSDIDVNSNGSLFLTIVQQLYKSTNGGINWINITSSFNGAGFQNSYVDNYDNVWAGTLNAGIMNSSDAGVTWDNYTSGLTSTLVNSFVADANGNLYAAILGKGLYSSTDNANTWNKITIVNDVQDTYIKTVKTISPSGLIVFNVYNGMMITTDLSSWSSFGAGLTNQSIDHIAANNNYVFAAGSDGKIFRTPISSANWVEITDTSNSGYCYELFLSSAGDLYYLFDEEIVKSTNNGDTWTSVGNGVLGYTFSMAEHTNGDLFVGTSNGVYRSTDAGNSWTKDVSGLTDGALSLAIHIDGNVFAGGYNSVNRSNDLGQSWSSFTTGIYNCRITDLAFGHNDVLFAAAENMGIYRTTSAVTSTDKNESILVENFSLQQNYPNPFNPTTKIRYTIPNITLGLSSQAETRDEGSRVVLKIYDILGTEISTLVNESQPAGNYEVEFSVGRDSSPDIASGVYFYKLQAGSFVETRKMLLLK